MIEPGAVFELPARLARPPQEPHRFDPAARESRWVLVVSTSDQCLAPGYLTVFAVLLSSQTEYAGENDVLIFAGEAVLRDSIAQADILFTLSKQDLGRARYRGTVSADTLKRVRAALARILGFV
ncbi:MAG: type II toxin-antitoxin system PemK/MazF family toxin [Pseudomonadota bacterium]